VEEIKLRGGGVVLDTVWYTRFGPIVYRKNEIPFDKDVPVGAAMRWTGAQTSNEILAFLKLNRARNYDGYIDGLATFGSPGQNFAFASATGDIAIVHTGTFPVRWQRQGRYIADGSDSAYDWHGWIPRDQLPMIKNPQRGFVSSANQYPTGPAYPYYMTGNYAPWDRSARINERLNEISQASAGNMRELQDDLLNMQARKVLPAMLSRVDRDSLTSAEAGALNTIGAWNYQNASDQIGASIFEYWWDELSSMTWDDNMHGPRFDVKPPRRDVTVELILSDPESPYFDNINTPERETLNEICLASFKAGIHKLTEKYGLMGEKWTWGNVWPTDIYHLARIPGFGRLGLPGKGRYGIVNATNRTVGPSWRMVVELGPRPKAQGVYPGGQSGNPGSPFYDDGIEYWLEGKLYDLLILQSPDTSDTRLTERTLMRNDQ
jgi:penicillin amidase